jgi:hypothetical protein
MRPDTVFKLIMVPELQVSGQPQNAVAINAPVATARSGWAHPSLRDNGYVWRTISP